MLPPCDYTASYQATDVLSGALYRLPISGGVLWLKLG